MKYVVMVCTLNVLMFTSIFGECTNYIPLCTDVGCNKSLPGPGSFSFNAPKITSIKYSGSPTITRPTLTNKNYYVNANIVLNFDVINLQWVNQPQSCIQLGASIQVYDTSLSVALAMLEIANKTKLDMIMRAYSDGQSLSGSLENRLIGNYYYGFMNDAFTISPAP